MSFLFTTHAGEVVEIKKEHLPSSSPHSPRYVSTPPPPPPTKMPESPLMVALRASVIGNFEALDKLALDNNLDGPSSPSASPSPRTEMPTEKSSSRRRERSLTNSSPLASVTSTVELPNLIAPSERVKPAPPSPVVSSKKKRLSRQVLAPEADERTWMVYNDYGELVNAQAVLRTQRAIQLTVTQIIRSINNAYRHHFRARMSNIIFAQLGGGGSRVVDDGTVFSGGRILSWELNTPQILGSLSGGSPMTAVSPETPRALEIGCCDGGWCFRFKNKYPSLVVEGVDDNDHWSCVYKGIVLRDFMDMEAIPSNSTSGDDYFSHAQNKQGNPDFTMRNLNHLLTHPKPIPKSRYGIIRAREIFDRVENYKNFLNDVRLMLVPDSVVEFLEIDYRPRSVFAGWRGEPPQDDHRSYATTDWTDNISDRFKNTLDKQLATDVPGWAERVKQRQRAEFRSLDGFAAPALKEWLEGAGFCDVKQTVHVLLVGGASDGGKLLKELILYQTSLEDEIPKLKDALPDIELDALDSGLYYINLHIITGRKPQNHRLGDLLPNGARQEMTDSKYDAMMRFDGGKTSKWTRHLNYDLDGNLTTMIDSLEVFRLPDSIKKIAMINLKNSNTEISPAMIHLLGDGDAEESATDS